MAEEYSSVMCRINQSPFIHLPTSSEKYSATKEVLAGLITNPTYLLLMNDSNLQDCSVLCTAEADKVGGKSCCEYRVQGRQCLWTNALGKPYLAPEYRALDTANAMDSMAVLCQAGTK